MQSLDLTIKAGCHANRVPSNRTNAILRATQAIPICKGEGEGVRFERGLAKIQPVE